MKTIKSKSQPVFDKLEESLSDQGYQHICGVDEVGRGPLAGPVVAAAVIMPFDIKIEGLTDSKKLTKLRRDKIFDEIVELNLPCAIGVIDNEGIDRMNILKASLMAMRKAVMDLKQTPEIILVDGDYTVPNLNFKQFALIGGDSLCQSIAAASVVAKVTRDRMMDRYEALYPSFKFSKHKGYPTPDHLEELKEHGPTDIHRRSFKPVAELLDQYALF